jgi:amino acid permease
MRYLNTIKTLLDDRLVIMLIPALLILCTDVTVLYSLGYAVAIVIAIVAVAHSVRLLLMPYLNLGRLIEMASSSSTASAVVVTAVLFFMAMLVHSMVAWIQAAAGH